MPTLTLVKTMPFPTPKRATTTARTAILVWMSKRMNKPHATVVTTQPLQIAHRKRPVRVVRIETTMDPGTKKHAAGKTSTPAFVADFP